MPGVLDPRRLRTELEELKVGIARRGEDPSVLDRAAALDARQRELAGARDDVRARVKQLSVDVRDARRAGDDGAAERAMAESRLLGEEEKREAAEAEAVATELRDLLLTVSNVPAPDCPDGTSPEDNVVLRVEGDENRGYADYQRVPHWDIGVALGILDLERGAKLSGSMFPMFRGAGATLVRALCQLALDRNADAFEEVRPPTLVRTDTMVSTGHLPKFEDDAYHLERDDLWAIPTAEVPLTSLHRDEVLDRSDLPVLLMAHTSCFRREAGSAGRDTRGLLRVHEFDKVEILAYAAPDQAAGVHADLLARAEATLRALGLTYRVVDLCAGDLGASSARTFDLEVYAARMRHVVGGIIGVVVHGLPGAPGQRALPPRVGQGNELRAHAQRLRARRAAGLGRTRRGLSSQRRLRRGARGAPAVHARARGDHGARWLSGRALANVLAVTTAANDLRYRARCDHRPHQRVRPLCRVVDDVGRPLVPEEPMSEHPSEASSAARTRPNSTVYRGRSGQWAFVSHRISGFLVFFFLLLHIVDVSLVRWPKTYNEVHELYGNIGLRLFEVGLLFALLFHSLNGLRIVLVDFFPDGVRNQRVLLSGVVFLTLAAGIPGVWIIVKPFFLG